MAEIYHNVSVRLSDTDYKKLMFLHNKYNGLSLGKVTLADILRESVNTFYEQELHAENNKDVPKSIEEMNKETIEQLEKFQQGSKEEVKKDPVPTNNNSNKGNNNKKNKK